VHPGNMVTCSPYITKRVDIISTSHIVPCAKDDDLMRSTGQEAILAKPRWDGSRILFEIEVAGAPVACAISRSALQDLSGRKQYAAADLLRCFEAFRSQIETIAAGKFRDKPESVSGIVSIWDDDIEEADPAAEQEGQRTSVSPEASR
jgi:hypothetical protein